MQEKPGYLQSGYAGHAVLLLSEKYWVRPDIGNHNSKVRSWPILLKTPVSASGEKFLDAMRGFVITDMRGHKCFPVRTAHPTAGQSV